MQKNVGLVVNLKRTGALTIVTDLIRWLKDYGWQIFIENEPFTVIMDRDLRIWDSSKIEMIIALGGDGTLLKSVHLIEGKNIPILGVNLGGLGFLTEVTVDNLYPTLKEIFGGKYTIEMRMMVSIELKRGDEVVAKYHALNEATIIRGELERVISIEVVTNGEYLTTYIADGLIIATPTGSTGYSLSAGGPIVNPTMEVLILTPICSHTLSVRPMILPSKDSIGIKVQTRSLHKDIMLTIDGQPCQKILPEDNVLIKMSNIRTALIKPTSRSFYEILKEKLKWGIDFRQI